MNKLKLKQTLRERKDEIIRQLEEEANAAKSMRNLVQDIVIPTIRRSDGKTLTCKLADKIRVMAQNPSVTIYLSRKSPYCPDRFINIVTSCNFWYRFEFRLAINTRKEGKSERIDADATIDMERIIPQLERYSHRAMKCEEVVENIDAYIERAEKLEAEIDSWLKEVPLSFRKRSGIRAY